jgi:hypothetical protein
MSIAKINQGINCISFARARIVETMNDWNLEQGAFKPCPGSWSASEIVEHLYWSEFRILNTIWRLKEECTWIGPPFPTSPHQNHGRSVDELTEPFREQKLQAPTLVAPTVGGPFTFWINALKASETVLERLPSVVDGAVLERIVFPHFAVGPLDGMQWLGFISFHMDRHRQQIARLKEMEGFPRLV